jgi:hypothetical protein
MEISKVKLNLFVEMVESSAINNVKAAPHNVITVNVEKDLNQFQVTNAKTIAEMESSSRANNVILETVGSGLSAKMDCLIPDVPLVACSSEGFTQAMTKRAM